MEDSILETIKKLLGAENMTEFDDNIKIFINSAINILTENGVGDPKGFRITGSTETWDQFITNQNIELFELCKEFVYIKVKIVFDTSGMSSYVLKTLEELAKEDLWRIREQAEPADYFNTNNN